MKTSDELAELRQRSLVWLMGWNLGLCLIFFVAVFAFHVPARVGVAVILVIGLSTSFRALWMRKQEEQINREP